MSTFLIRSAISQSSSYSIVLTRLGGPRSRTNRNLNLWKCRGSNPRPHDQLSDMLTPRPTRRSPKIINCYKRKCFKSLKILVENYFTYTRTACFCVSLPFGHVLSCAMFGGGPCALLITGQSRPLVKSLLLYVSILLNTMFHAPMERFPIELKL